MTPTEIVIADPSQDVQEQQQAAQQAQGQEEGEGKDKDKKQADSDDGSTDAALGLINTAPVQMKNDLEQPVTSGGMDTGPQGPGPSD